MMRIMSLGEKLKQIRKQRELQQSVIAWFFRKHPYFTILKYCNGCVNQHSLNQCEIKTKIAEEPTAGGIYKST